MRFAVMGVGGIGGCFGGRLAAAGHDVLFIARGAHLAALQADGLKLTSALGDLRLPHVTARPNATGAVPADVVVVAVKGPDIAAAAEAIAPLIGPRTIIVPFMNGVEHVEILQRRYGASAIVPGISYVAAVIEGPGHVRHVGSGNRWLVGSVEGNVTGSVVHGVEGSGDSGVGHERASTLAAFAAAATQAGLGVEVTADILRALWEKFVLLGAFTAVACLSRLPVGTWTREPETLGLFVDGMREIVAVAAKQGVSLEGARLIEANLAFMHSLEPDWKGSMLNDLERGKPIEIESLSGYVHRLGRALGVPTPLHSTAYRALYHHAGSRAARPRP